MRSDTSHAGVRLDNLRHSYPEGSRRHAVLNGLSLDMHCGQSIALRGRSGSGKSTLLNLVSGIDAPDGGSVWIDGRNITAMSERDRTLFRRRHIGFVYQSFNLIPTLTVADNVGLVLELNGLSTATIKKRVPDVLQSVGLHDRSSRYPEQLSGGEQQRVAIARALVHQPSLLLADEPTGNLDDDTAASVLELLDSLRRDQGATLIMATHSPGIAERCERVIELRAGQLAAVA